MRLLSEQVAFAFFRRKRTGEVLQAGEVIDADVVRDGRIVLSVGADMNERGGAAPIFVGGVGEENPGHDFFRGSAVEQSSGLAGHGIFLGLIGERENIRGKENRRSGLRIARRLGETIVEAAAAGSGNVGENAVERDSSLFVGVEALVEKVAQKAPVLRNAFAIDARRAGVMASGSCLA